MSTANIVHMEGIAYGLGGCYVEFETHDGPARIYYFAWPESMSILGGADPAYFAGEEVGEIPEETASIDDVSVSLENAVLMSAEFYP